MAIKTQGLGLWYVDPDVGTVMEVGCPTSIDPGSGSPDKIDVTCLNQTKVKQYVAGLEDTSEAKIGINADPSDPSHIALYAEYEKSPRSNLKFVIGWADGTTKPTFKAATKEWTLPNSRTWFGFDGEIATFPFNFEANSVVKTEITITRSGAGVWTRKTA